MKTKLYELRKMTTARLETVYKGVTITLNFRAGFGTNGVKVGQLITSNEFVQDAIESDPRYESMFSLKRTYEDKEDTPVDNYELKQVPERKQQQKTNAQIFAENQAKLEKKKQEQKKADAKTKTEAVKSVVKETKPMPEPVDNVKSINDVISFFAEKGDLLKDPADIPALCAKHNVTFPNLKTEN